MLKELLRWIGMVGIAAGWSLCQTARAQDTRPAPEPVSELSLPVGCSTIVQTPWPVARVSVTEPKTADVQVLTPRQVLVSGKATGSTDLILWSKEEEIRQIRLEVVVDRSALVKELKRLFPQANLEVRQAGEVLVIAGMLRRAEEVEQLRRFMDASGIKYTDLTTIPGVQQVQIKVVLAEASRTAVRALGINATIGGNTLFGGSTIGPENGGPINPISIGVPQGASARHGVPFQFTQPTNVSPATTLFAGFPGADLEIFVQALAENQYVRLLAEPNLVALSGQDASFLAGGEFPIPVVQGGTSNSTSVSIEYKEFGVRLKFRPTVLGDGSIRLKVAPEVSELSTGPGAVQIQGFNIPAILTRRAETTLELSSGQTFAMAGLISQSVEARNSRVPGLGDIPLLGSLFRSVRYQKGDTELVVLVTASLVEPSSAAAQPPLPGSLHVAPSDWELYLEGRIEGRAPARIAPADSQTFKQMGLERLKGPGAWANDDSAPASSGASIVSPPANAANHLDTK